MMATAPPNPHRRQRRGRGTASVPRLILYEIMFYFDERGRMVMGGVT